MNDKEKTRIRCSDEKFLEAIFSSSTYSEVAEKTGQKITTTMARYSRIKSALSTKGIDLPKMQRKKPKKTTDNIEAMAAIVARLKAHHKNS